MNKKTWLTLAAAAALFPSAPALAAPARSVAVKVTNEFRPAEIRVKKGEKVDLVFTRTTDRTCATEVVMKDLGVNKALPLNRPVTVSLQQAKPGRHRFACAMDMIAGTLVVE